MFCSTPVNGEDSLWLKGVDHGKCNPPTAEKVRVELIAVAAQAVSSSDCAEPCYDENGFTEVKRGGYSECAELALKSLEGYLRALDGEHARTLPSEAELPPDEVLSLLTSPYEELGYKLEEGEEIAKLEAKILIDEVEVKRLENSLHKKFAETYPKKTPSGTTRPLRLPKRRTRPVQGFGRALHHPPHGGLEHDHEPGMDVESAIAAFCTTSSKTTNPSRAKSWPSVSARRSQVW